MTNSQITGGRDITLCAVSILLAIMAGLDFCLGYSATATLLEKKLRMQKQYDRIKEEKSNGICLLLNNYRPLSIKTLQRK